LPYIELNSKRVLFIHVPRTGGTSVESWLASIAPLNLHSIGTPPFMRHTPQHLRYQDVKQILSGGAFDYCLAIIRNPFDRFASEFRLQATLQADGFWKSWVSFSAWAEENLNRTGFEPWHLDNHLRPQWEFLGDGVEVFRYEDGLEAPVHAIAKRLGVLPPSDIAWEYGTQSAGIPLQWDLPDRVRVQEHYQRDFAQLGYDPNPAA
jgi:hypothetical protein